MAKNSSEKKKVKSQNKIKEKNKTPKSANNRVFEGAVPTPVIFSTLLQQVQKTQETFFQIERLAASLDMKFSQIRIPMDQLDFLVQQFNHWGKMLEISVTNQLSSNISNILSVHRATDQSLASGSKDEFKRVIDQFRQQLEDHFGSKLVSNRNISCKFCGHLLLKIKGVLLLSEVSVKCPKCGKLLALPQDAKFIEIK